MNALVKAATEHWAFVAPLLTHPRNEAEYDTLVAALDELLAIAGTDNGHPLDGLVAAVSKLIEGYEHEHVPIASVSGVEVLRHLMQEHRITQRDLPEIGSQSTVFQLLAGKRKLNLRQVQALAKRFGVNAEVFLG
ncbi:MAG: Antitoxin HigA [Stenotrophomonas maltophilia]|nr:MAG: Antitoxin HigA [Stenotrophomonas maltophilia]